VLKLVKAIRRVYRGGEKGFTLIELLVVVGILAALAGVVTLGVTQFIGEGRHEGACTEVHNVQTAVAACMAKGGDAATCAATGAGGYEDYLLTSPSCVYTIDASTGEVTDQDCSAYDPWSSDECL
jgi:prepilin-type N-terminal cleavage/methylation domain-containing protein